MLTIINMLFQTICLPPHNSCASPRETSPEENSRRKPTPSTQLQLVLPVTREAA